MHRTMDPPTSWSRLGLQLPRHQHGLGSEVVGDPAIVWDPELPGWRMFLFFAPPGHGEAICRTTDPTSLPTTWSTPQPLQFTNPGDLMGGSTHKPVVIVEAEAPNQAARIAGRYWLLSISFSGAHKVAQRAWATSLSGPWTVEPGPLIDLGSADAFDGKHVDAINALWFPDRGQVLYTLSLIHI
jgi:hypothetical protein